MANSRIAKFITEAAPPQYINVIRHRASKLLDTISEEDRDVAASDSSPMSPTSSTIVTTSATYVSAANSTGCSIGIENLCRWFRIATGHGSFTLSSMEYIKKDLNTTS
ncbi:hypothetical protein POTOM_017516 [Populus tomentosa]|uniref:Uncharacterized protein n=1 Tax=Populus tomentosa TaxID=118781 RepID=A0A8X8A0C2_POPTO|nr:hypothetical protein POTOM_017516 [Populus tomentosa]